MHRKAALIAERKFAELDRLFFVLTKPLMLAITSMVLIQFSLRTDPYVRAHKRDPFLVVSIESSLTVATLEAS